MKTETEHNEDILPWYVNETLTDQERRGIEGHLKGCEQCRSEVAYLMALRSQVKTSNDATQYGKLGLKRLLRDIKREGDPNRRRFTLTWWQSSLAIAATLVIVVQSIVLYDQWQHPGPITTLSGPVQQGVVLQVSFAPDATEAQIRKVLQAVEGSLIDGPGAMGVYRVRLAVEASEEGRIDEILATLKAHSHVVAHAAKE